MRLLLATTDTHRASIVIKSISEDSFQLIVELDISENSNEEELRNFENLLCSISQPKSRNRAVS